MVTRNLIYAIVGLAALTWGIVLFVSGVSVEPTWIRPFSLVVGLVVSAFSLFDRWLWKWPILHPWLVPIPNLAGTWRGEIKSHWINPETNEHPAPIETYAAISQTYSNIRMRVMTKESASELLGATIVRDLDGNYVVTGTYRNTPDIEFRHRSPIHHGAILLEVVGRPPSALKGQYWTDRNTIGGMAMNQRVGRQLFDYATAQEAFSNAA